MDSFRTTCIRQFDYGTITDAVVHIKYMAREDAGPFKNAAIKHLREYFEQDGAVPSLRLFNLRQEFPTQWHRFLHPVNPENGNVFDLDMSLSLFLFGDEEKTVKVTFVVLLARCTDAGDYSVVLINPPLPADSDSFALEKVDKYGGLHFAKKNTDIKISPSLPPPPPEPPVKWQLKMTGPGGENLQEDSKKRGMEVEDLLLVLGYKWDE